LAGLIECNVAVLFDSLGINLYLKKAKKGWQIQIVPYFKNLEIFKSGRFALDHLLILTQPSLLSSCDLRSCGAFLLSGPL